MLDPLRRNRVGTIPQTDSMEPKVSYKNKKWWLLDRIGGSQKEVVAIRKRLWPSEGDGGS